MNLPTPFFLLSTLDAWPRKKTPQGHPMPEIAIAGRSNTGKSSLINHLFRQKNLAKTSSKPGKTQLLNFYAMEDQALLVDLPGYGFAKASKETVRGWSQAIDAYLNQCTELRLLLLLIDIRRGVRPEDLTLIEWANHQQVPFLPILTKKDKLPTAQVQKTLEETTSLLQHPVLTYSIQDPSCRQRLQAYIAPFLKSPPPK